MTKTYIGSEKVLVKRYMDENGNEELIVSEEHKKLLRELVNKKVI